MNIWKDYNLQYGLLITYRHDVKRGNLVSWLFQNLRYARFNSKYQEN